MATNTIAHLERLFKEQHHRIQTLELQLLQLLNNSEYIQARCLTLLKAQSHYCGD